MSNTRDYESQQKAAAELKHEGWGIIPPDQYLIDLEDEFRIIWEKIAPFTMTSVERAYALWQAVRYLEQTKVHGVFTECGVWKGGSCMLMAQTLADLEKVRPIYLYDTFGGMTEPGKEDIIAWNSMPVSKKWEEEQQGIREHFASWAIGLEEVKKNLSLVDYNENHYRFIPGDVSETLKVDPPEEIALLRLDTDWYESTRLELELLYPRLSSGGILIIDDYGHFKGARKAVDEYFKDKAVLFQRIDYTGRLLIKT